MAAYLSHLITAPASPRAVFTGDLLDPIAAPFASLSLIVPILLASDGLFPQAATPAQVITDVFIMLTVLLLGLGVLSWIVLGSLILGRLLFRPLLSPALQPTLAIEVAPAAVASLAWFAIHGARIDMVTAFLAPPAGRALEHHRIRETGVPGLSRHPLTVTTHAVLLQGAWWTLYGLTRTAGTSQTR